MPMSACVPLIVVAVDRHACLRSRRRRPPTMLNSVDLPQPDGPMMETNSPGAMVNETSSTAVTVPSRVTRALGDIADVEQRPRPRTSMVRCREVTNPPIQSRPLAAAVQAGAPSPACSRAGRARRRRRLLRGRTRRTPRPRRESEAVVIEYGTHRGAPCARAMRGQIDVRIGSCAGRSTCSRPGAGARVRRAPDAPRRCRTNDCWRRPAAAARDSALPSTARLRPSGSRRRRTSRSTARRDPRSASAAPTAMPGPAPMPPPPSEPRNSSGPAKRPTRAVPR